MYIHMYQWLAIHFSNYLLKVAFDCSLSYFTDLPHWSAPKPFVRRWRESQIRSNGRPSGRRTVFLSMSASRFNHSNNDNSGVHQQTILSNPAPFQESIDLVYVSTTVHPTRELSCPSYCLRVIMWQTLLPLFLSIIHSNHKLILFLLQHFLLKDWIIPCVVQYRLRPNNCPSVSIIVFFQCRHFRSFDLLTVPLVD